jgi:hypothetical protein
MPEAMLSYSTGFDSPNFTHFSFYWDGSAYRLGGFDSGWAHRWRDQAGAVVGVRPSRAVIKREASARRFLLKCETFDGKAEPFGGWARFSYNPFAVQVTTPPNSNYGFTVIGMYVCTQNVPICP